MLVVEDEWLTRADIADQLRDAGFVVLEAENAESAMEFARNGHGVDVVFTDIRLPGKLNGWDVGEAFRSAWPETGVIYASGTSTEPHRKVEESRFFAKPYQPHEIVRACREISSALKPAKGTRR